MGLGEGTRIRKVAAQESVSFSMCFHATKNPHHLYHLPFSTIRKMDLIRGSQRNECPVEHVWIDVCPCDGGREGGDTVYTAMCQDYSSPLPRPPCSQKNKDLSHSKCFSFYKINRVEWEGGAGGRQSKEKGWGEAKLCLH